MENLTSMGLVTYHSNLNRKERVKLKNYVASMLELSYSVIDARFTGRAQFTKAELIALKNVISQELWKG